MRYGTIGTSWITEAFIAGAAIAGGMELTAVFSRSRETGQGFAARHGNPRVFTDLQQMAESEGVSCFHWLCGGKYRGYRSHSDFS